MKQALLILFAATLTGSAHAQAKVTVEKAVARPDRAEQSARADLYVLEKTSIADSTTTLPAANGPRKNKKKRCNRKHGK